jgi:hypothetical protein
MVKVTVRPTVAADLPAVIGEPLPFRIKAITLEIDGRVLGLGGLAFPPGRGPPWAFVQQCHEAKRYPVSFHRAGLAAIEMIRKTGVSEVVATADADNEAALRWLKRLGFVPAAAVHIGNKMLFVWRNVHEPSFIRAAAEPQISLHRLCVRNEASPQARVTTSLRDQCAPLRAAADPDFALNFIR